MKLSTRLRYGLRGLIDIAMNCGERPVMLREISERQGLSKGYLAQLMILLEVSGLVRSVRGKKGGFVLAKPPEAISVLDVVTVLEGPLYLVDCVYNPLICDRKTSCPTFKLWQSLNDTIRNHLRSITLKHLVDWAKQGSSQEEQKGKPDSQ